MVGKSVRAPAGLFAHAQEPSLSLACHYLVVPVGHDISGTTNISPAVALLKALMLG
jgi:hypothetical protein